MVNALLECAASLRLFQAEFKAHHEVDPGLRIALQRSQHRRGLVALDAVGVEDLVDLLFFIPAALHDFAFFAQPLAAVVLGIAARREIAAQPHGDGPGGDLGQPRKHDDVQGIDRAGETGGEREGHGEAVRHADDDVADGVAGLEVCLMVMDRRRTGHGGSVEHVSGDAPRCTR